MIQMQIIPNLVKIDVLRKAYNSLWFRGWLAEVECIERTSHIKPMPEHYQKQLNEFYIAHVERLSGDLS
jgi:hypothetical protein